MYSEKKTASLKYSVLSIKKIPETFFPLCVHSDLNFFSSDLPKSNELFQLFLFILACKSPFLFSLPTRFNIEKLTAVKILFVELSLSEI